MPSDYPDDLPDSPGKVMLRMMTLEREIAELEPDWGKAEAAYIHAQEHKKLREAQLRFPYKDTGTVPDIDAKVRDALWNEPEGYMARREEADATRTAKATRYRVLQAELMSLQTRLNAMTRDGGGR